MGDQRHVACLHFDSLGAHALGHEAFKIRIDGAVFGRDSVETWLRAPSRLGGLARQQRLLERFLDRVKHPSLRSRQIAREVPQERLFAEAPLVAVENDAGGSWWCGKSL